MSQQFQWWRKSKATLSERMLLTALFVMFMLAMYLGLAYPVGFALCM